MQSVTRGPPSLCSLPREFRFTSEVPIWLDYHGKHVTMDQVVSRASMQGDSVGQALWLLVLFSCA
jgi:hypothetical protein